MQDTLKTLEVLKATTANIRADYIARYTELELAQLVKDRAGLAAVGMDARIYCPYPSGSLGRKEYRAALAKRSRITNSFMDVPGDVSRRFDSPEIKVERADAEPRKRAAAAAAANALVTAYLIKLAGKIGKTISTAATNGRIWDYATLTVICEDGEVQVWKTSCILNRSVYGKIFNQWPTRRQS